MVDHGGSATKLQPYLKLYPSVLRQHPWDFFNAALDAVRCGNIVGASQVLNCMNMVWVFNLLRENAEEFDIFLDGLVAEEAGRADTAQAKRATDFWLSCGKFFEHVVGRYCNGQEYDKATRASIYVDLLQLLPLPILI